MTGRLRGRAALITGGARGIGRATAAVFAREGARLGLIDHDGRELEASARELAAEEPGTTVHCRVADIADAPAIDHAVRELTQALGGLDVLVNNAAARAYGRLADATPESWAAVLQTNVVGFANCARAALPYLRASRGGSIVNVSSAFALTGRENMGQYDASKAAVLALTRVLACEEAKFWGSRQRSLPRLHADPVDRWSGGGARNERGGTQGKGRCAIASRPLGRARRDCISHSLARIRRGFFHDRCRAAGRWRPYGNVAMAPE
jgi:NADP-dependent 3-hydroxy acid dehydrogenase YdfG